jgi:hypothetical protein
MYIYIMYMYIYIYIYIYISIHMIYSFLNSGDDKGKNTAVETSVDDFFGALQGIHSWSFISYYC